MAISIHQIEGAAIEHVIPVLLQAEHSERALRWPRSKVPSHICTECAKKGVIRQ